VKTLLREPLLHFLLLGALLFAASGLLNRQAGARPQEVVVTPGQIEHLLTTFSRTWQRPPTEREARGLIDQYVREEIFSREAVKLGLDRDDTVIRRRLQQKMEFISEDLVDMDEPTDAALARYLAEHPDDFRKEDRITFRQVFLSGDKRGQRLERDGASLLSQLRTSGREADLSAMGDATLLPSSMTDQALRNVEHTFGAQFAAALPAVELAEWSGPIRSAFGLHLVLVERREAGGVPDLAEARDAVQRAWENERRKEGSRRFYERLLEQYQITIEWPATMAASEATSP
jgi:hypothetical protein